jgi:glycosyltransferase involved in cell wall biosynthesis
MKVAYAYEFDAADPMVQSGRPASILQQLEAAGVQVLRAFPLRRGVHMLFAPKVAYYRQRRLVYRPDREPWYLRSLAAQIRRRVREGRPDVVFAPGSHAVAMLDVPCPVVFCADATFANVLDCYDSFSNCADEFIAQGHAQERAALGRCAAAIYPSTWAARRAIDDYGADPARVHVVPFGANVEAPDAATVDGWIAARDLSPLRLLFVGREWERKGADTVLATCSRLHAAGYAVSLDLVGIDRPPVALPGWAYNHGLLDKRDPDQRACLQTLYAHAHFFFVPSQAENYGMAFCEAAAHGLPSLTTDVGGIPTIVRHGRTGYTLSPQAPTSEWAAALAQAADNPDAYRAMARASRADYEARLSWDAFGARLRDILERVTGAARARYQHSATRVTGMS